MASPTYPMSAGNGIATDGVTIRPMTAKDIPAVRRLDGDTWFAPECFPDRDARDYAVAVDVLRYLPETTFGAIAEHAGRVLGVAMGAAKGESPLFADADHAVSRARGEAGRHTNGAAIVRNIDMDTKVNMDMSQDVRADCDAELQLFIVSPEARGLGIGRRLFSTFLSHLRDAGARSYYLFTDTGCDYGFYDRHGLTRAAQRLDVPSYGFDGLIDKFVYVGALA